ncbi:MAG TPA: amino acid adenylation domain-containing protein [Herpetosiphonaceae bacterium]
MMSEDIEDIYKLSPIQQGLLFHSLAEPESGMYCDYVIGSLGPMDPALVARAWQIVIEHHPILRTAFAWEDLDEPLQFVQRYVALPCEQLDWRDYAPAEQEDLLAAYLEADQRRGFDLTIPPLLRLTLIRRADDVISYIFTYHHLLMDGWSFAIIWGEVIQCYEALLAGREVALTRRRPYRDYLTWLRRQNLSQGKEYWRQVLAGFTIPTPLGIDRALSPAPASDERYAQQAITLPAAVGADLQTLARQHRLTLSTLFHGMWALLLGHYSGEDDLVFGSTSSGRPESLRGSEAMVGLFINTLPLRVRLSPDEPLLVWLQRLQEQQLALRQYEYTPLVEVQRWSDVPPGQALFESIVVFENFPVAENAPSSGQHDTRDTVTFLQRTNYPLTIVVRLRQELTLRIDYDSRRFDAATIRQILGHMQTVLEAIVAHPAQRVAEIALMTAAEQEHLLAAWSATTEYPQDDCLHLRFEAQAARTPDAPALTDGGTRLTYRELSHRSNQLAHHLRALGVGGCPQGETRVALYLERSAELIVGLLGVLKAGGCYVPLDPTYPQERLRFMLEDSAVPVIITERALLAQLPPNASTVICIDRDWPSIAAQPTTLPVSEVAPQNLAYIIYTSGSTGRPKGVMVAHAQVVRLFSATQAWFHFDERDVWTLFHSAAFDFSVWEIWGPLLHGGRLVVVPYGISRTPEAFYALLRSERVTVLNQTPTAFRHLIRAAEAADTPDEPALRLVIFGGEALDLRSLHPWIDRYGDQAPQLVNMYGITETTVHVTYRPLAAADVRAAPGSLIGVPIPDLQVYLLDDQLRPVAPGVPGEIYVGGAGVARGYLNRPDLTAARFIPHPFDGDPTQGARLYKTGDRARSLCDGGFEYLGRIDQQVKIRGFRIELGEIAAVLRQHEAVRDAVVLARADNGGEPRLVAYVVPSENQGDTTDGSRLLVLSSSQELHAFLAARLPEYMVPAAFVVLDALPLTTNGKLDVRALPMPETHSLTVEQGFVPPRTPVEEQLAAIWAAVLGLEQVGIHDNFFSLGGDSILSLQVISRANQIGLRLRPTQLFQSPTIAALAAGLRPHEAQPAEHTVGGGTGALTQLDQAQIERLLGSDRQIVDLYPLTPVQQGMLFHTLYAPESGVYVEQVRCLIEGMLDQDAFERSWQQVVDQHAILRTAFLWEDLDTPLQVVREPVRLQIIRHDWRDQPVAVQAERLAAFMEDDRVRGFDLRSAPLLRLSLLQLSETTHQFIWTAHHLLLDGWSMSHVLAQVLACYTAWRGGAAAALESSRPYREYIAWLQQQDLARAEAYWRQRLAGFTNPTPLVVDTPAKSATDPGSGYAEQEVALAAALSGGLQALARRYQITLNTLLQGAWALLLSAYSGEHDIVFGSTVSGRPPELAGSETMVGMFINTLPVRVQVSPTIDLAQWLGELQAQQVDMRQYEYSPLAQIREWSDIPRGQPLFESILVFENYPVAEALKQQPAGLAIRDVRFLTQTNYPLTVSAVQGPPLTIHVAYDVHQFDALTIARMLGHIQTILERMVAGPEQRLKEIALVSDAERRQLLVEWNTTTAPYPSDRCLHELVEAQVARMPDAVAVAFEDQRLTYGDLNRRANQIAHHVQALGVGPDIPVAICMERSPELLAALLGVLKAGGCYVPLDPTYPQERLQFMLADSQAPILLTQSWLAAELPANEARVICLDDAWSQISQESDANVDSGVDPDHLAYIIYTSGSMGRPKGVQISHRAIGNTLCWSQRCYPLTELDRVLHIASFSFDISVWELIGPLLAGAQVIMAQPGGQQDSAYLAELMAARQVTIAHLVPSLLRMVLEEPSLEACRSLLRVFSGGEALPIDVMARLHARLKADLIQLYGPTEASINATHWFCQPEPNLQRLPIGQPISNMQIYVLDQQLRPVPVGVPGELHIGGAGLARGYLNRPDLTAERFIPDPFSRGVPCPEGTRPGTRPGGRLYRTGDRARYRADGAIEFLGRVDHQVKIRGFRIELGEIEATLLQHPAVREAVVLVREDVPGEHRLVAYVVAEQTNKGTGHAEPETWNLELGTWNSELRKFLAARLPAQMIPAAFVVLDALPLTANGKVNRHALPVPDQTRPDLEAAFVAPQSMVELALAEIWASVLRVDQVGVNDNFFDLGGDSILSIQLAARARQAGIDLSPRQVFDYQTIAELAAVVTTTALAHTDDAQVTGAVPLMPIQHRFFEQARIDRHHFNQSVLLELIQPLDFAPIERAVQQLVLHHDALRLRFVETPTGWEQQHAPPTDQPICTRFDLSGLAEPDQHAALKATAAELQGSFSLGDAPLMRVAYFDRGALPGWLLLIVHHLVVDGVSWRILLDDLQTAYYQISAGQPVTLPPKTTSFKHWAERLHAYAQTPEAAQELDFWLTQSDRYAVSLPVDDPVGENTVASSGSVTVALSAEETAHLLHDVPGVYATQINDLLLTALVLSCADWLGERGLLLDLEGHGREDLFDGVDLSRTVGWFTSLFPVYLDLSDAWEPGTAIKSVKEQLRRVPRRGIGYGILRYLRADSEAVAQLRALPRAEISFNYLGQFDQALPEAAPFRLATAAYGPEHSPRGERQHLIDINGFVAAGALQMTWTYSRHVHRQATIERLAHGFIAELQALIAHCLSPDAGGYTPSDFPLIGLNQQQIDKLIANARTIQEG